jgi:cobalt-zinc-cadmium efflux system outer membrane protein
VELMLNKHDKILLLTTVLTLMQLALPVQAQNSVLSAAEAVKTAVSENPGLAEMQARFRAMSEIPSQMGTLPDPVLSFGAMNFPTDSFDRDQEPMTQLQVGISQAFPFPGKLNLREEAAEFDAQAAFYTADEMRLMLIANGGRFFTSTVQSIL